MKTVFFSLWLVLMGLLWGFEWTRHLMMAFIGLGVLCMAMGLLFSVLTVVWEVSRRWLVTSGTQDVQPSRAPDLHPLR